MTTTNTQSNTATSSATAAEAATETIDRAAGNLLAIGKLWANHGLEIGLSALSASAESHRLASESLAEIKARLQGTNDTTPAA